MLTRLRHMLDAHCAGCCHAQRTKFPENAKWRFSNIQNQLAEPFVVYADFESILKTIGNGDTTQVAAIGGGGVASFQVFQEHVPWRFAYKIVSSVDTRFSRPLLAYMGEDAAQMFVRQLQEEAQQLFDEYIDTPQPLLTNVQLRHDNTATH